MHDIPDYLLNEEETKRLKPPSTPTAMEVDGEPIYESNKRAPLTAIENIISKNSYNAHVTLNTSTQTKRSETNHYKNNPLTISYKRFTTSIYLDKIYNEASTSNKK